MQGELLELEGARDTGPGALNQDEKHPFLLLLLLFFFFHLFDKSIL